jgi:hypothetical protein
VRKKGRVTAGVLSSVYSGGRLTTHGWIGLGHPSTRERGAGVIRVTFTSTPFSLKPSIRYRGTLFQNCFLTAVVSLSRLLFLG